MIAFRIIKSEGYFENKKGCTSNE